MEFQENPIVVKRANMSWGINCIPTIITAADKGRPTTTNKSPNFTTIAMTTPLARIRQRTERKATINLPPSSPSRGPRGRMVLIIPKRRILNNSKYLI